MKKHTVKSFSEFHSIIESYKGIQNTIFRGIKDKAYELKPSVGRCQPAKPSTKHEYMEKRLLTLFKESSLPYMTFRPENDWEWIAIAQHHGLPTRFMDWSYNPLVAAFFAVEKDFGGDSVIYVFWGASTVKYFDKSPLDIDNVVRYRPPHVTSRITAQAGLFTVHPDPTRNFEHKSMERIVIKSTARADIKKTLYKYGVSPKNIFPGLDGLTDDLKWLITARH